jgi:hypothetical protein
MGTYVRIRGGGNKGRTAHARVSGYARLVSHLSLSLNRPPRARIASWIAAVLLVVLPGCSRVSGAASTDAESPVIERTASRGRPEPAVAPSHCPPGLSGCRTAEGRIAYVERVDPDGDGDAHFVIVDSNGITLPWLTAIDVGKGLRPHPLPGVGDLVSAAGPVETGSYGQSQIAALELHVSR